MKILAFIPARGGSKGIPGKNLALLAGKPLIQYTIEAARAAETLDDIFMSSDDAKILHFAESLGLDVCICRPAALADDRTPMIDTVLHALDWLEQNGRPTPDALCLLQPTSPLRAAEDIDGAVRQFLSGRAESLMSVHEMKEHPYECVTALDNGWKFLEKPPFAAHRRQDYRHSFYFINGAVYIATVNQLRHKKAFIVEGETDLFVMPPERGPDIDTPLDLALAEAVWKHGPRP